MPTGHYDRSKAKPRTKARSDANAVIEILATNPRCDLCQAFEPDEYSELGGWCHWEPRMRQMRPGQWCMQFKAKA